MSRKRKTRKINLITFFLFFVISINAYANWGSGVRFPESKLTNENAITGKWYMPKPGEPQIIVLHKNNQEEMDNFTAPAGTILYYIDENGNAKVYTTRKAIRKNERFKFPDTDSTTGWVGMSYDDNSENYSGRQQYYNGDLVVFKEKIYEYSHPVATPHNPNTSTQKNPEEEPRWWKRRDDLLNEHGIEGLWLRYKIYFEGDVVFFKGKYYKSLKSGYYNKIERIGLIDRVLPEYWQEVTK